MKLAIKNEHPNHPFPIIKRNIQGENPPIASAGLRLATYQGPVLCGDRKAIDFNLKSLAKWAEKAAAERAHILAVAELFLCGYNIRPQDREEVAITLEEATGMIAPIALVNDIALLVPYAESTGGDATNQKLYDSMLLVDKDGTLLKNYRKTQLWGSEEKEAWRCGHVEDEPENAYSVVEVNGIKVGMLNCYEAEFPELSRILALNGAQVILIPTAADVGVYDSETNEWSNWAYPDVSNTCIVTNAYHNKLFCAYINHSLYQFRSDGKTMSGIYLGNSTVVDPMGQTMVKAENVETMLIADCVPSVYPPTHPEGQSCFIRDRRPDLFSKLTSMSVIDNKDGTTISYPTDPNRLEESAVDKIVI